MSTNKQNLIAERSSLRKRLVNAKGIEVFKIVKDLDLVTFQLEMLQDAEYKAIMKGIPDGKPKDIVNSKPA